MSLFKRIKLAFKRAVLFWDHETKVVLVLKEIDGLPHLIHEEQIEYGDMRNAQISRLSGRFFFKTLFGKVNDVEILKP